MSLKATVKSIWKKKGGWAQFSDDVEYLIHKVGDFEEYYMDMQFKSASTRDLIRVKSLGEDSEEWFECDWAIPEELDYFTYA